MSEDVDLAEATFDGHAGWVSDQLLRELGEDELPYLRARVRVGELEQGDLGLAAYSAQAERRVSLARLRDRPGA